MPPAALTNDMMIFYAPRELYTMNVTVLELICASVCLTSMICFTLEAKYRKENPFDSEVHMARHRMGARGNATSFPLPWQELLAELQRQSANESDGAAPDLPWTGEELSNFVSILLKTSEEDNPKSMASFIHQARVRRDVVVKLIEGAKARGHRAYRLVDMDRVRLKAEGLPTDGVPPEIVRLLPHDDHLDKVQVQKAATPVAGRVNLESVGDSLARSAPNGVVLEKSSHDEGDINAQRVAAVTLFAQKLEPLASGSVSSRTESAGSVKRQRRSASVALAAHRDGVALEAHRAESTEAARESNTRGDDPKDAAGVPRLQRLAVVTGNAMIDQFQPWYFGVAFAYVFSFCTGMPDMPEFAEKQRYRREADAPRVEPPLWVRIMARRIEAQVSRDWFFGFVTWNYLFRSAVNLSRTMYSYETVKTSEGKSLTAEDLQKGAVEICKALSGK